MARKIRIECEQRTRAGGTLTDLRTGAQGWFYRGEAIAIEVAIFAAGKMLTKADITSINVKVYSGATLLSDEDIASTLLSANLTTQQWRTGTGALFTITYDDATTGTFTAGMLTFQVTALVSGASSVYASGTIESVTLAGLITGVATTPGPPTSYTKAESDALYDTIGSGSAAAADIADVQAFIDHSGESVSGSFMRATAQTWSATEQQQARTNISAAVNGGTNTINGKDGELVFLTGLLTDWQTRPDATRARLIVVTPAANTDIELRAPTVAFPIGIPHMLKIQQGYVVKWTSHYSFPTNEITTGAGSGDFAKQSYHPSIGDSYEKFELVYDGTVTHVRRWRKTDRPEAAIDWDSSRPFMVGSSPVTAFTEKNTGVALSGSAGTTPTAASMTTIGFLASNFSGGQWSWAVQQYPYSRGFAIAIVFEATATSADKLLFSIPALGVEASMQTSGGDCIRFKAIGSGATSGLKISSDFGAPVAAVLVVLAGGTSAFVVTTSNGNGGNGSLTPAVASGTTGYWGGNAAGNYLTCKIARFRVFGYALTPDQARAELDALTAGYKIG